MGRVCFHAQFKVRLVDPWSGGDAGVALAKALTAKKVRLSVCRSMDLLRERSLLRRTRRPPRVSARPSGLSCL